MKTLTIPIAVIGERRDPGFVELRSKIESNGARASYNFARRATSYARRLVPVDTGYLLSQIEWERISKGVFEVRVNGSVQAETGAYYAIYVEFGTRYMRAQPFFRPAIALARREFIEEMKAVFR